MNVLIESHDASAVDGVGDRQGLRPRPRDGNPAGVNHRAAEELKQTVTAITIINLAGDLCLDCGHTKTCCFTHKDFPIVGSSASPASFSADLIAGQLQYGRTIEICRGSNDSIGSVGNRAPPWTVKPTLLEMHQQLLV